MARQTLLAGKKTKTMLRSPEPNFKELQTYHNVKRVGVFPTFHAFPLQPETQTMGSRLLAWESFADHLLCPMRLYCSIPERFIVNDYRGRDPRFAWETNMVTL